MKYICIQDADEGIESIVIFPKHINHDRMAFAVGRFKAKTVSAGFIAPDWTCFGRSETLNMESRKEDTELLAISRSL